MIGLKKKYGPEDPLPQIVLPARRGPQIHSGGKGGKGFLKVQVEGAPTTTRQAEVLNTALIGSPDSQEGVLIGTDDISGAIVTHDPFTAYAASTITSPNVCVVGMVGSGKSSLLKTVYVERPLLLLGRQAVVVDKKMRGDEGEYAELTREYGADPFRFDPDAVGDNEVTCMNPLDPIILAGGGSAAARQLLAAIAQLSGTEGQGDLNEWHHAALDEMYRMLRAEFEHKNRVPVIPDLLSYAASVVGSDKFKGARNATLDLIEQAAWSLRFRFERLLADDLQGMFDRETSKHVKLHPKLTTFDISALPEDGPSTSMVMVVANAWLMGMLTKQRDKGMRTNFVVEEGWHLITGPGGKIMRSKTKLSRGLGLSVITAIHHISDIPDGSDAIAMIKEAQTLHLFRQEHDDDITDCIRHFNLEPSNAHALSTLNPGTHLLKVGANRELQVTADRTAREIAFTETDAAMIRKPTATDAEVLDAA